MLGTKPDSFTGKGKSGPQDQNDLFPYQERPKMRELAASYQRLSGTMVDTGIDPKHWADRKERAVFLFLSRLWPSGNKNKGQN
jgi:hypothetical protein